MKDPQTKTHRADGPLPVPPVQQRRQGSFLFGGALVDAGCVDGAALCAYEQVPVLGVLWLWVSFGCRF